MSTDELNMQRVEEDWKMCENFLAKLKMLEEVPIGDVDRERINLIKGTIKQYVSDKEETSNERDSEKENRRKPEKPMPKLESDSEESSHNSSTAQESSTTSDSSEEEKPAVKVKKEKKRGRKMKKEPNTESEDGELSTLNKLLQKLDSRTVPRLECFEEDGLMTLEEYFDIFEEYCHQNYKGRKYFWLSELKKSLNGKTLQGFNSIRQNEENYDKVKKKLLKWYKDEEEARKRRAKNKFEKCKRIDGEDVLVYSNRLLSMYKKAYPKKRYETSNKLIEKLLKTIPSAMKHKLENQILNYKLRNKNMTWEKIQKCMRIMDMANSESEEKEDPIEEVIKINFSKPANRSSNGNMRNFSENYKKSNEYKSKQYTNKRTDQNHNDNTNSNTCTYCGFKGHGIETCRKRLGQCYKCGTSGHLAKDCRKRPVTNYQRRHQSASPKKNYDRNYRKRSESTTGPSRQNSNSNLNSQPPASTR